MPPIPHPSSPAPLLLLYGGTFDPVHNGHLAIARALRAVTQADVALLPAADPPHKSRTHADAGQRTAMLELALADAPGLRVDCRELRREGPSYSIDTLRELRAEFGPAQALAWLIGSDSLAQLPTWKDWRALFDFAHIIAVERPGAPLDLHWLGVHASAVAAEIAPRLRALDTLAAQPAGGCAWFVPVQPHAESSTEIRQRIRAGVPWQALVPAAVAAYIGRHGLYRGAS